MSDETKAERIITNTDIECAYKTLASSLMSFFPDRVFLALGEGPDGERSDVYGAAVVATKDSHDGWGGPTVIVACAHADDPDASASEVTVSGRHALEQLRAAIDFALGDEP
jgi:hypothetical protein